MVVTSHFVALNTPNLTVRCLLIAKFTNLDGFTSLEDNIEPNKNELRLCNKSSPRNERSKPDGSQSPRSRIHQLRWLHQLEDDIEPSKNKAQTLQTRQMYWHS